MREHCPQDAETPSHAEVGDIFPFGRTALPSPHYEGRSRPRKICFLPA